MFVQFLMLIYPLSTLASIYCAATYYIHFNFADGLIRLIYTIFLFVYPFVTYLSCLIIAGSLNRVVLDEQDKLPQNAEFLDFEDDEEDIMRKATIMIVKKRIFIQRFAMPFIQITGWFKVMSHKDFLMQIYISYLIEIIVFSLPITILMLINNAMLQKWNEEVVIATSVMGFNLLLNLRNVISISDLLNQQQIDLRRKMAIKEKQKAKLNKKGYNYEEDFMDEDPTEEDIWNSTKFSSQRVYKQTIKLAILAFLSFVPPVYVSFIPFFEETCGIGYF